MSIARASRQRTIQAAAVVAVAVVFAVFVLPWIVPTPVRIVISDSQAVGFNNQVAMVGLAIGMLALFWLSQRAGRAGVLDEHGPFISVGAAPAIERVSPWLLRAGIIVVIAVLMGVAAILQDHPYSDALYFANVFLRVSAGGAPFSEIEFSYGPLLFYMPYLTWRLIRGTGVSIYPVYYTWVVIFQSAGLGLAAFILNRISLTRALRNGAFIFMVLVAVFQPTLSLGYTFVRYLLPYALFIWVTGRVSADPRSLAARALPLLAVVFALGVSPEMGVALMVALAAAMVYLGVRESRDHLVGLAVLLVGVAAILGIAWLSVGSGTVGGFAGGAFYFPVLPSPTVLLFVAGALTLAWGVGRVVGSFGTREGALHGGWLALAIVLIVPAFGRADMGHVILNALGVTVSCAGVVSRKPLRAAAYLGVAWLVYAIAISNSMLEYHIPILKEAAVKSVLTSQDRAEALAVLIGKPREDGIARWEGLAEADAIEHETAAGLAGIPKLAYPNFLSGEVGDQLAESGNLVPMYVSHPGAALTKSDYERLMASLEDAENIAMLTEEVARFKTAAQSANPDSDGVVMFVPESVGGRDAQWDLLLGFPVEFRGRNAVFNPVASFGVWLEEGWAPYRTVGSYTILKRR